MSNQLIALEVELRELCKARGFDLVENPAGWGFWTVYDTHGNPTDNFMVRLKPSDAGRGGAG